MNFIPSAPECGTRASERDPLQKKLESHASLQSSTGARGVCEETPSYTVDLNRESDNVLKNPSRVSVQFTDRFDYGVQLAPVDVLQRDNNCASELAPVTPFSGWMYVQTSPRLLAAVTRTFSERSHSV